MALLSPASLPRLLAPVRHRLASPPLLAIPTTPSSPHHLPPQSPPPLHHKRHRIAVSLGQDEPGASDTAIVPEGEGDSEPPVSSDAAPGAVEASAEPVDSNPEDLETIREVKMVLELLQKNRDMTFGEVNEGRIPENRVALRLLAKDMTEWPDLEIEAPKKKSRPGKSVCAKATDTGIDPETAAKRFNIDWDSAADIDDKVDEDDEAEVPSAVGYGVC